MSLPNPLQPFSDFLESLQPSIHLIQDVFEFVFNNPILSVFIVLVILFLSTGLIQSISDKSRIFWDSIFVWTGRFAQFLFGFMSKTVTSLVLVLKQKLFPIKNGNI